MRTTLVGLATVLALMTLACEPDTGTLRLALASGPRPSPAAGPQVVATGDTLVLGLGSDTLILRTVGVVLKEIELKRVEADTCDQLSGNGDCEEFEAGPLLLAVPLSGSAVQVVTVSAPAGMYDELEFEVHTPEAEADAAFVAAHPDFALTSIRVTGTFSHGGARTDFTFISDLEEEQEVGLDPPLTVVGGQDATVTLRLDVSTWFLSAGGAAMVDPATANKGGPNENLVRDNIQASIDAFRDDDHDGHDDDDPDDD